MTKRLLSRPLGRCIGLDVHLDFIEIAICEEGKLYSAGRVPSTPEGLNTLAESLMPTDRVALEVTGSSWEIVRLLEPHVSKVIVVSPGDTGISQARAKTDRLDARTLAKLLWTGELEAVWVPPEWISRMRRRLARRQQLVRARSRAKNEIHAVLMVATAGVGVGRDLREHVVEGLELERVLGVGGGLEQSSSRAGERVAHALVLRWIRQPSELVGLADRGDSPLDR